MSLHLHSIPPNAARGKNHPLVRPLAAQFVPIVCQFIVSAKRYIHRLLIHQRQRSIRCRPVEHRPNTPAHHAANRPYAGY